MMIVKLLHLEVWKDEHLVLQGLRNNSDGLWDIPLSQNSENNANFQTHTKLSECPHTSKQIINANFQTHTKLSECPHTSKQIINVVINNKTTISNINNSCHTYIGFNIWMI